MATRRTTIRESRETSAAADIRSAPGRRARPRGGRGGTPPPQGRCSCRRPATRTARPGARSSGDVLEIGELTFLERLAHDGIRTDDAVAEAHVRHTEHEERDDDGDEDEISNRWGPFWCNEAPMPSDAFRSSA